jgi:hypothetical protein
MLNDLSHTICYTVISILALTTGNRVYLISTKDSTAGVTGQQRMLTPPRHLILPLVLPEVRVSLIFTVDYSM